ncbi:MAG: hypothetical protein IGR76_18185 [Synechococcales cyanobacterium T60_A2020_003]|nr:hypothetical protein [Synechococcales cyanobacterium T60_A2020_003]
MADINGAWLGTYWQAGLPTRFEATLVQSGNSLTGNILDDGYLGEALITGSVTGRSIHFTKRYVISSPYVIEYAGTISEDESFMTGEWKIDYRHSGKWEAHRSGNSLIAELQTRLEKPVVLAGSVEG